MSAIHSFLLKNGLRIRSNPCISPDFCLDWPTLSARVRAGGTLTVHEKSAVSTADGSWTLVEDEAGDHAWRLQPSPGANPTVLEGGILKDGAAYFPASFANLIRIKNRIQEFDPESTVFPTAGGKLGSSTLGIGARFTTLHWPAVEWAMAQLGIGLTANQNSIPREIVYDVDQMLAGRLDTVPFPFIGTDVPEGHQGQSIEGMSHGAILSKLKTGFHLRRIPWSFNADHQPVGGKFDAREAQLVEGSIFASYITFDLLPELNQTRVPEHRAERRAYLEAHLPDNLVDRTRRRAAEAGIRLDEDSFETLLCTVWPALKKMKRRDDLYAAARGRVFTTDVGRRYLRELSIDELPGLTPPETTGIMLALCELLGMPVQFVAPAFGFQKNMPFPDDRELRERIERQWKVCRHFGVSIGFHSGSGKSASNYRVMGEVTGGRLEIKTSGRYTYEMGVALSQSSDARDHALWLDWHRFTRELALGGAFSQNETERSMARSFIQDALAKSGRSAEVFSDPGACRAALEALTPSPDHMFWFEYNFLFVLAAQGRAEKAALGDHSPVGYAQRARFYSISDEARLLYAKRVADYIVFLAEQTGLAEHDRCAEARQRIRAYPTLEAMLSDIAPQVASAAL